MTLALPCSALYPSPLHHSPAHPYPHLPPSSLLPSPGHQELRWFLFTCHLPDLGLQLAKPGHSLGMPPTSWAQGCPTSLCLVRGDRRVLLGPTPGPPSGRCARWPHGLNALPFHPASGHFLGTASITARPPVTWYLSQGPRRQHFFWGCRIHPVPAAAYSRFYLACMAANSSPEALPGLLGDCR